MSLWLVNGNPVAIPCQYLIICSRPDWQLMRLFTAQSNSRIIPQSGGQHSPEISVRTVVCLHFISTDKCETCAEPCTSERIPVRSLVGPFARLSVRSLRDPQIYTFYNFPIVSCFMKYKQITTSAEGSTKPIILQYGCISVIAKVNVGKLH